MKEKRGKDRLGTEKVTKWQTLDYLINIKFNVQ